MDKIISERHGLRGQAKITAHVRVYRKNAEEFKSLPRTPTGPQLVVFHLPIFVVLYLGVPETFSFSGALSPTGTLTSRFSPV